jgi:hypothetical protein
MSLDDFDSITALLDDIAGSLTNEIREFSAQPPVSEPKDNPKPQPVQPEPLEATPSYKDINLPTISPPLGMKIQPMKK